jgi:hypothetical protein
MYRWVVERFSCPASSWMALAGAPRIAKREQKVCRRTWSARVTVSPSRFCAFAIQRETAARAAGCPLSQ